MIKSLIVLLDLLSSKLAFDTLVTTFTYSNLYYLVCYNNIIFIVIIVMTLA